MSAHTHFKNLGFSANSPDFHQAEIIAECLGNVSRTGSNRIFNNREIDQVASCTINNIRQYESTLQKPKPTYL